MVCIATINQRNYSDGGCNKVVYLKFTQLPPVAGRPFMLKSRITQIVGVVQVIVNVFSSFLPSGNTLYSIIT
jgi:hypothetical protein